jgi:hypothetical protein
VAVPLGSSSASSDSDGSASDRCSGRCCQHRRRSPAPCGASDREPWRRRTSPETAVAGDPEEEPASEEGARQAGSSRRQVSKLTSVGVLPAFGSATTHVLSPVSSHRKTAGIESPGCSRSPRDVAIPSATIHPPASDDPAEASRASGAVDDRGRRKRRRWPSSVRGPGESARSNRRRLGEKVSYTLASA